MSDVDVLILTEGRSDARLVRELASAISSSEVSVLLHDERTLRQLHRTDWSFVRHLECEHLPAFGDVAHLEKLLRIRPPSRHAIQAELYQHLDVPRQLEQPEILGGRHLVAYGRLYGAVKSAAIIDGILGGEVTFDRRLAIEQAARRHPRVADELRTVAALEPFWLRLRRRNLIDLPWSPRHDQARLIAHAKCAETALEEFVRRM